MIHSDQLVFISGYYSTHGHTCEYDGSCSSKLRDKSSCKQLADYEKDPGFLLWTFYISFGLGLKKVCVKLILTCKARKAPTAFRYVDETVGTSFLGFAKWAEKKMPEQLDLHRIFSDRAGSSVYLVEKLLEARLRRVRDPCTSTSAMSLMPGTVQKVAEAALLHLQETHEKHILRRALMWLEEHQFTRSGERPQPSPMVQILRGSGMELARCRKLANL